MTDAGQTQNFLYSGWTLRKSKVIPYTPRTDAEKRKNKKILILWDNC